MKQFYEIAKRYNYAGYIDRSVTFPTKCPLPFYLDPGYDVWEGFLTLRS